MKPAAIGLADALKAAHALKPRDRAAELVLELCGLERATVSSTESVKPPPPAEAPEPDDGGPDDGPAFLSIADLTSTVRHLEPVRQRERSAPSALPDPLATIGTPATVEAPFDSLFGDRLGDDLLRAAGSVTTPSDHPDVARLVERLSRAEPLVDIPRRSVPALTNGLHVLVDVGETMEPFSADQRHLADRLHRVVGGSAIVSYFDSDPALGAGPDRRRRSWKPFTAPNPGQPVLALTDLGCGFPMRAEAISGWLRNALDWRARGCRVVVFAPVRLDRVPAELQRRCDVLVWDRAAGRRRAADLARILDD